MGQLARLVLTVELLSIIVLAAASLVIHAVGKRPESRMGRLTWWQLTAVFTVTAVESFTLLLILYRVQWPAWVLITVYGLVNAVMAGWLVLRWRARRNGKPPPVRVEASP